ncbi:amino acid permease [Clostridium botulinum]|uniref:Amino acid permease family protein n=1 Tax=Clostridium botulinum D str. 1873 TaxID=592027 RepID=A0A9P2LLS3_CLOBO|nr:MULTISPECIES: amino acid permease [Clostridium]AYF54878.1 amino acid permease [Clostridium novyi]EES91631.1 amino acid permease family protein [Clostridium botulinum D str. 1873]MBO3441891.1 amino acid permease [Clostridium haemolyticum]MCD3215833.1 amino acid permease [Clostridium botulinum C]MCD3244624.1 amino acid permease [Clostridium botulinum C]
MSKNKDRRITWSMLAFMAFSTVWGFGNVINGFSEYDGLKAIVSWIIIFAIYFVPYALMVGELGSAFKEYGGGVSSWIHETIGAKLAYYAGWTYWIVHMPYISQKPSGLMIATSWAIFQDKRISSMNTKVMQLICLIIFLIGMYIASKGLNPLKKLATLAGTSMFIMSILFIILMITAPAITDAHLIQIDWSLKTFMPTFDMKFFTSLAILVFAVGGCEKISPYVNKMKNPETGFSKGMITLSIMVAVCAILGTISLGMMFDSNNVPKDLMTNGAYYAFQKLGNYYKLGNIFVVIYAITNIINQFAVLILSIDAPLHMLLDSADENFIPKKMFEKNKYGAYKNGNKLILIIVSALIIVPALGIRNVDELVKWLVKLNAVCMPLRYLWVFVAYIALKKVGENLNREYYFVKNKTLGIIFGVWCFAFTAFACIGGMYSTDMFKLVLNIITPFVLIGLGVIMPYLAKKNNI